MGSSVVHEAARSLPGITVSVVSHGQGAFVRQLLQGLAACPDVVRVIITINIPENSLDQGGALDDRTVCIHNLRPRGYAANHNAAFALCETRFFCVLNPDIRIQDDPFPLLVQQLELPRMAFAAPLIRNPQGAVQDSARLYPSPLNLLMRLAGMHAGVHEFQSDAELMRPDWIAGMFMLFRSAVYAELRGFDEGYFLYCEDTDICWRARREAFDFVLCRAATVVHDARRTSHRDLRYALWHARSMARFLGRYLFLPSGASSRHI